MSFCVSVTEFSVPLIVMLTFWISSSCRSVFAIAARATEDSMADRLG